jgi:hypothetical protein
MNRLKDLILTRSSGKMILTFCLRAAISNSGDNVSDRPIVPEIL